MGYLFVGHVVVGYGRCQVHHRPFADLGLRIAQSEREWERIGYADREGREGGESGESERCAVRVLGNRDERNEGG